MTAIAIGDLNHDGILDIAYTNGIDVRIFRGMGGGNFASAQPMAGSAVIASGIAIADVDDDGFQDLITWDGANELTGSPGTNTVRAHRQSTVTAGTFLAAQTFTVPNTTRNLIHVLVAPKLDDDQLPDLLARTSNNGTLPFFAVDANPGTFTVGTTIGTDDLLQVTDVDGDGFDDVVFETNTTGLKIIYNNTATPGTFDAPQFVGSGNIQTAGVGRFSSNSPRKDLVVMTSPPDVALFVQTTPRAFVQQNSAAIRGIEPLANLNPFIPTPFDIVDINDDNKDDVLGGGSLAVQCAVGTFYPDSNDDPRLMYGEFGSMALQAIADLDANGKLDLVQLAGQFLKVHLQ